jgi:N-acetylmuramic acid 6-phosphate etherase
MLRDLLTEAQNPASSDIDSLSTFDMLRVINAADQEVALAVERELPNIARAVDSIVSCLEKGGHLFYVGAGTSGRLGVLDASECPPTFNTPPDLVQGLIAGGDGALRRSIEKAEDDPEQGTQDLVAHHFSSDDVLVGIAASGRTPYVLGAVAYARSLGALSIGLSCTPDIVTGSTRLRAGTATKLVLNMLSTGTMIRLGYVYGNLMVNVQPTNEKLIDRARRIIAAIARVSYDEASRLLSVAGSVRTAIVMHKRNVSRAQAEAKLAASHGRLRAALDE